MGRFVLTDGNQCNRVVSSRIYSEAALSAAKTAFLQHCAIRIEPAGEEMLNVTVAPIGEGTAAPREAILAFWNFVLDSEAQSRVDN